MQKATALAVNRAYSCSNECKENLPCVI